MLGGGLLRDTANLVEGAPGTGKTTLGMQFIYNGIQAGEPGLIITFEEFPQQYYYDAAAFGWDFKALEKQGMLKVVMTSPEASRLDIESVDGMIETYVNEMGARRVVVDSISQFSPPHSGSNRVTGVRVFIHQRLKTPRLNQCSDP